MGFPGILNKTEIIYGISIQGLVSGHKPSQLFSFSLGLGLSLALETIIVGLSLCQNTETIRFIVSVLSLRL